ncbi:MAG: CBS domain-containing protein [Candidatus Aenigmatarchaeota archaeon]|nr:MAG: CBS domain-containing protein [Candidatus Aenigmarchaeota archaeon]
MSVRSSKEVMESIFGAMGAGPRPEALHALETLTARDIMEKRFVVLSPQATIREAANIFVEKGIEGAPVAQEGILKGVVTHHDMLKAFEEKSLELSQHRHGAVSYEKEFLSLGNKRIAEIMRKKAAAFPHTSLFDTMTVMDENNVEIVAVIDEAGRVLGVISDSAILKVILKSLV